MYIYSSFHYICFIIDQYSSSLLFSMSREGHVFVWALLVSAGQGLHFNLIKDYISLQVPVVPSRALTSPIKGRPSSPGIATTSWAWRESCRWTHSHSILYLFLYHLYLCLCLYLYLSSLERVSQVKAFS